MTVKSIACVDLRVVTITNYGISVDCSIVRLLYAGIRKIDNIVKCKRRKLTIGSGASACWHITQGTPVSRDVAIDPAHLM